MSVMTYELAQTLESEFGKGELIHIAYTGFLTWNKGGKSLVYKEMPINFGDRSSGKSMYESPDLLKSVKFEYDTTTYAYTVFICDEMKYIKKAKFVPNNNGKYEVTITNDYYVNQEFTGESANFAFSNRMLYYKFQAFLCQERGNETEDLALICEPESLGIENETMSDVYPLKSKSWLLFYGVKETDNNLTKEYEALLVPEYNQPKVTHLNPNDVGYYKAEYFYYHN
jgi:hypothetical protein